MHWIWMIKIGAIDHVLNISILLICLYPLVLLLHYFLKWISEIALVEIIFHNFVQSWIQFHYWIVFSLSHFSYVTHNSHVVPVLWVILQKPGIIIFCIEFWILYQIGHFLSSSFFWSTSVTLIGRHVIREKLFNHAWFCHLFAW